MTIITIDCRLYLNTELTFYDIVKRIVNPLSGTFTSASYVKWSYLHPSDIIDRALLPCHQPLGKLNIQSLSKKFQFTIIEDGAHTSFLYTVVLKNLKVKNYKIYFQFMSK